MAGVLVVSPHPDDESIGCGGTIACEVAAGVEMRVIFLTSGEKGINGTASAEAAAIRESEAEKASSILGVTALEFWRQPDGALRATEALARRLADAIDDQRPERLYVTHGAEQHPDHRAAARLVRAARRLSEHKPFCFGFEVWTPLQRMHHIVDISAQIETKLAAVRVHESQLHAVQFDHAVLGLARYRGEMHSWPGGPYAEVFEKLRP